MGIVWIASYPKSGNTWIRFLLANYLAGPIEHSAQVEAAVPGYSRNADPVPLIAERGTLYVKTHFPWGPTHPHAGLTDGAIVVVRHPKDVLLSSLNYRRLEVGHDGGYSDEAYARWFIQAGGDPLWLQTYGNLESHVRSWLGHGEALSRLMVRYEDLKADAAHQLTRILSFLRLPVDAAKVARAAADSSFESMRAMERREKARAAAGPVFAGAAPRPDWQRYFVSEGRSGATLAGIAPDLDRAFDERFAPVLHLLGYSHQGRPPVAPSLSPAALDVGCAAS